MRRTESVCRSPIYNHFSETITGAAVIRAYKCADRFVTESRKRVDKNIKFFFAANTGARLVLCVYIIYLAARRSDFSVTFCNSL